MKAIPATEVTEVGNEDILLMVFDSGITRSRIIARRGGTALASVLAAVAFVMLEGCPSADPVQTTVPPVPPQVEVNGLMHCDYANGVLSNCALNPGATLDDLANSLLKGTEVTTQ